MRKMTRRRFAAIIEALVAEWKLTYEEAAEAAAEFFGEVPNGDPA